MPVGDRLGVDVLQTQHFMFEAGGMMTGFFMKCTGLSNENEVIEEKRMAQGFQEIVFKQPGRLNWGTMTLERGITNNMDMWTWRNLVITGGVTAARVNCTLTLLTMAGQPACEWNVTNAWPSKLDGPSFKTDDNNVGIETVTLVYESFERTS